MWATRRELIVGMAVAGFAGGKCTAAAADSITPEAFGAKGDGRSNDTEAFAALSAHVNARGGGTIILRRTTYIVGKQVAEAGPGARFSFAPSPILHLVECSGPVVIQGNGAVLRCAPGLRFGMFDPGTAAARSQKSRSDPASKSATPYLAMIRAERCTGTVEIRDLELDGNLPNLVIGARSLKHGWQIQASGIQMFDNRGPERLSNIHSHHHPLDGLTLYSPVGRASSTTVVDVRSEFNGRQGCSLTGGRNYSFERCRFSHTGKAGLYSNPGAGVDIEAGRHPIRDVTFSECEFSNNTGPGVLADTGPSERVTFTDCKFVGTTGRSAWPNKPRMRFSRCTFVGSLVRAYGSTEPEAAAQFHECTFSDDPALSPTGQVFGGRRRIKPIAVLPNSPNVMFNRCAFTLSHDLVLPLSTSAVIYSDCIMSQKAPALSKPRGTYLGTNRISGNADVTGSIVRGDLILNGRTVARTA